MELFLLGGMWVSVGVVAWMIISQRKRQKYEAAQKGGFYLGGLLNACLNDVGVLLNGNPRTDPAIMVTSLKYNAMRDALDLYLNEWCLATTANDHVAGIPPRPCSAKVSHIGGIVSVGNEVSHYGLSVEIKIGGSAGSFVVHTPVMMLDHTTAVVWTHLNVLKQVRKAVESGPDFAAVPL